MASIVKRPDGKWRARYRDSAGKEHAQHFSRKVDGQRWLDEVTASVLAGTYVDPKTARMTVAEWVESWLEGYSSHRESSVRQARVHSKLIVLAFGPMQLAAVKPSHVKSWLTQLGREGRAESYIYALHIRLAQILSDAVHDGIIARSPCSRRTSPGPAAQRPYVATTEQVWALHDAMPHGLRASVLLGAFVGLRVGEIAALRPEDVNFMRGIVSPVIQWSPTSPTDPRLKSGTSYTPVPIPSDLSLELSAAVAANGGAHFVVNERGEPAGPWTIERAMRSARKRIPGLPAEFRIHDLRHYYASLLIASGLDVKNVQARLRHSSATTTLNTYGHLWPDSDESARAAISGVLATRADSARTRAHA